jgi:hypothetical protein
MSTVAHRNVETHSRAKGVEKQEAGFFTKLVFWRIKRRQGHLPLTSRIRANDPKLLVLAELMNKYTAEHRLVSPKLKDLAQLKVAMMVGCPF